MNLNPEMLEECKNVIFNECNLPESNKEPVHLAVKMLGALEYSYKDFLSREVAGPMNRMDLVKLIIDLNGGNGNRFMYWVEKYENPTEEIKSAGTAPAWES